MESIKDFTLPDKLKGCHMQQNDMNKWEELENILKRGMTSQCEWEEQRTTENVADTEGDAAEKMFLHALLRHTKITERMYPKKRVTVRVQNGINV